jgi:DNA-binding response OmpR family regulator
MTYEDLLVRVWGAEYRGDIQFLRTWISRLRKKIEEEPDNPRIILTVTKMGYMLKNTSPDISSNSSPPNLQQDPQKD